MTSKQNIEAVPTTSQRLRQAIGARESIGREMEDNRARAARLAPLEAELAAANAALQGVLQKDADAMHAWAVDGANDVIPEPNHKAREAAARRVSDAQAKLNSAGMANAQFDAEYLALQERGVEAQNAVKDAQLPIIEEEILHRVQLLKDAARRYLMAEQFYYRGCSAAYELAGCDPLLQRAAELAKEPFSASEKVEMFERVRVASEQRLEALLRGDEPTE